MSPFWHLAIECSAPGGSVALLENVFQDAPPILRCQICLPTNRGSVQTLSPAIQSLLTNANLRVRDLEFLSITVGPGSFTGLRVGLATAKMLAMAANKPIVPVDTLAAIAQRFAVDFRQSAHESHLPVRLVTAINAYRKQVFTASWIVAGDTIENVRPSCVSDIRPWLDDPWRAPVRTTTTNADETNTIGSQSASGTDLWISGAALQVVPASALSDVNVRIADAELWIPLAEHVGLLGWQGYHSGRSVTAAQLAPNYLRESAAEEKRRQTSPASDAQLGTS